MVSIIIPVYNSEETIIPLLDTICSSMYLPFEILCVNDGSTDATARIIMEYKQNHNQVFLINQNNKGPSAARNRGIAEASGEWIMFADSDDSYIGAGLMQAQQEITKNPTAELFVFRYTEVSQSGSKTIGINQNLKISVKMFLEQEYKKAEYLYIHSVWNKIYKKKQVELAGYMDEEVRLGEDAIFNTQYFSTINDINVCADSIYNYIIRGGRSLMEKNV